MKLMMSVTLLMTATYGTAFAQAGGAAGEAVIAAQQRFAKSHQTCDAKEMADVITDDIIWIHPNGHSEETKVELLKSHANPANPNCPWDVWKIDVRRINTYSDTAAVVFGVLTYSQKGKGLTGTKLTVLQTFVKRNGQWLLAASETTQHQAQ